MDDTKAGAADEKFILRRKGEAAAKAANARNLFYLAVAVNSVDLTGFPASPKITFAIKSATFRMVQTPGEDFKMFDRDFRFHAGHAQCSSWKTPKLLSQRKG
jgi:hypothetical protein